MADRRSRGVDVPQGSDPIKVDQRKAPFLLGGQPTIADISLAGYLYYPAEEFGFDIGAQHKNIGAWRERIRALPGWAHPYDLMPGYPFTL